MQYISIPSATHPVFHSFRLSTNDDTESLLLESSVEDSHDDEEYGNCSKGPSMLNDPDFD